VPLYFSPRVSVDIFQSDSDFHLRGKFGKRSEGYAYVIAIPAARSGGVALSHVRWNGDRSTVHLARQRELLRSRESPAHFVSSHNQIHCHLPGIQVTKTQNFGHTGVSLSAQRAEWKIAVFPTVLS